MGTITIHAGDFPLAAKGLSTFDGTYFAFPLPVGQWGKQKVSFKELLSVDIVTEETVRQGVGPLGRGLVGLALAGPAGLLLGALSSKSENKITFIAKFQDGRELLGTCEQATFVSMKAALVDKDRRPAPPPVLSFEQRMEQKRQRMEQKRLEAMNERSEEAARRERKNQEDRDLEQKWRDQGYSDKQIAVRWACRNPFAPHLVLLSLLMVTMVTILLVKLIDPHAIGIKPTSAMGIKPTSTGQAVATLPPSIDRQAWTSEAIAKFLDDNPDARITSAWVVKSENVVWVCAVGSSQWIARSTVPNPRGAADFQFVKDDFSNVWQKLCGETERNDMPSAQSKPHVETASESLSRQMVERYYGAVGSVWTSSQGMVCGRLQDGHRWWIVEPGSSRRDAIVMEGTPDEGAFDGQFGSWALYCS